MHGVPSSLIARNQSWVRQQAHALMRRVPSNVEKADLIQVGLIAVAQASLVFAWHGERDTPEAAAAFVRYARVRVKGAMLDELRQMDQLGRGQRRQLKALQVARERWCAEHGGEPGLLQLSEMCNLQVDEVARLLHADASCRQQAQAGAAVDDVPHAAQAITARDEVEARVDTGIVLRRLERFFAQLPERERRVIDAYMGVGLTPVQLASDLQVTPSRVSQMFRSSLQRIARHFGQDAQRASDRAGEIAVSMAGDAATAEADKPWSRMLEQALTGSPHDFGTPANAPRMRVCANTRWG